MKRVIELKNGQKIILRHLKKADKDGVWKNFNEVLEEGIYLPVFTPVISEIEKDSWYENIKREKIAVQKWLAMFPEGCEAWAEMRRTGYPKFFPVIVNNSGGVISTEEGVKRLNFSVTEVANNPTGVENAVTLLGGSDDGSTQLWWDVD